MFWGLGLWANDLKVKQCIGVRVSFCKGYRDMHCVG